MKKAFILLMSLVAMMTANLNVMAQETATAKASMGGDVIRSQSSFITNGNWNDGSHWDTGTVPPSGSDVVIMADAIIPAGYTAVVNEVSIEGGSITVADGGQLRHNTDSLVVTMKKNIVPYNDANGTDNYYILAFPFNVDVAVPNAMTANEGCDFYKFDGDFLEAEWRNNKQETIATVSATTGYLYANSEAIELSLTGSTYPSYNEEVIPVTVPYDEGSTNPSNGWALLGNPFTCNAYIYCHNSDNELVPIEFMVYDATGELMTLSDEPIAPMQGFFVKVTETTTVYILNYADHSFHEYVDLGLPSGLLWATCNVGADTPEEYGDYFAWGETQPKENYQFYTYQFGEQLHINKYCTQDYLIVLLPEDDAATANWGANWRMAREDEWQELRDNTTRTMTTQNGVKGLLYTASNGNSIFMPAAGYRYGTSIGNARNYGYYWTSSLGTEYAYNARKIYFYSSNYYIYNDYRCYGMSVRAVRSAPQSFIIEATVDPAESGTISGDGAYDQGRICTLTATANEGYVFNNWSENGVFVSAEPTIAFTVNENRNLVAHFAVIMNGHAYVDLGLPSGMFWANCNVGADNPEDYGDYFAWGETQPRDYYSWSTYQYCHGTSGTLTKYCNKSSYGYNGFIDNLTTLLPVDDAATANWGYEWRMPTQEEWQELFDNTTNTWTTKNGVNGRAFTAANGNSVFMPAAGSINGSSNINIGSDNYCWSSSLGTSYPYNARCISFSRSSASCTSQRYRFFGHSVRAVRVQSYTISVSVSPSDKGNVSGDGPYEPGSICTLTATPNEGYAFTHWTEDGEVVSTDATYSFTVTGDRNLVANFDHGYVDLGLPSGLLWATCNVGADTPEEYGDYFAWGETQPKENYDWSTYQYCMGSNTTLTKYCSNSNYGYNGFTDNLTTLLPEDDAAAANWGGNWRMPTKEEFQELYNNTTVTWTQQNGVNGRLFTASNGNSLFLPAAGNRWDGELYLAGDIGDYWSSSLTTGYPDNAWYFGFGSGSTGVYSTHRYGGLSVRAVREN